MILPVNNEKNIPSRFGLRHRAAIGITEKTDALALVVSEETGQVSYVNNGEFVIYYRYTRFDRKNQIRLILISAILVKN